MSEMVEVTVTTFDAATGKQLSSEVTAVQAPPPDEAAALVARIEAARQGGLITEEQRDVILGG